LVFPGYVVLLTNPFRMSTIVNLSRVGNLPVKTQKGTFQSLEGSIAFGIGNEEGLHQRCMEVDLQIVDN
jgi:hypothetical protein